MGYSGIPPLLYRVKGRALSYLCTAEPRKKTKQKNLDMDLKIWIEMGI